MATVLRETLGRAEVGHGLPASSPLTLPALVAQVKATCGPGPAPTKTDTCQVGQQRASSHGVGVGTTAGTRSTAYVGQGGFPLAPSMDGGQDLEHSSPEVRHKAAA